MTLKPQTSLLFLALMNAQTLQNQCLPMQLSGTRDLLRFTTIANVAQCTSGVISGPNPALSRVNGELVDFNSKRIWPTKSQSFLILSIKKKVYFALTWKQSPSENYITKYYRKKTKQNNL